MTSLKFAVTFLSILSQASFSYCIDLCSWETTSNSKSYSFNLFSSAGHAHGIRSEDGFYKVSEKEGDGSLTVFWFQPCEHMKFNYDAPMCDNCESCGGPLHCGETCSALQATSTGGYPVCTSLGFASNQSFSLIDPEKPELGVKLKMIAVSPRKTCSLSIFVHCSVKQEELPTVVTKDSSGSCDYTTSIHHSAGCPIVTSVKGGGMGWFGTLLIVLLCGLIVYFAVGIAYRMTVLGVSGLEAFPHLDFWKALPHNIQLGFEAVISYVRGCYRRFTEPTYMRVNEHFHATDMENRAFPDLSRCFSRRDHRFAFCPLHSISKAFQYEDVSEKLLVGRENQKVRDVIAVRARDPLHVKKTIVRYLAHLSIQG